MERFLARISVQLRQTMINENSNVIAVGPLTLDENAHEAAYNYEPIRLTKTEYAILRLMMLNPNYTIAKSVILERIALETPDCTESSLKQHISNLRVKLRNKSGKDMIEAIWGIGYKLNID